MEIEAKLLAIISDYNKFDIEIDLKSLIKETVGIDSFSFINMIVDIEHEFNINFTISELAQCLSIDNLISIVSKKINKDKS